MSQVYFVPHSASKLVKFLRAVGCGRFVAGRYFTVRRTIYYPDLFPPARCPETVEHEMVHVDQWERLGFLPFLCLYFLVPLPVLFSGRWFIEREAYLVELKYGVPVDRIVEELWTGYTWPWPKALMRRWFQEKVA